MGDGGRTGTKPRRRKHPDAFISYTRGGADLVAAVRIEKALTANDLTVWRDQNEIDGGDHFFEEIVLALQDARTVIAVLSNEALEKDWVLGEVFTATAFDKIIPVLIDRSATAKLPYGLGESIQYLSADDLAGVLTAVEKHRKRPHPSSFLRGPRLAEFDAATAVVSLVTRWPENYDQGRSALHASLMSRATPNQWLTLSDLAAPFDPNLMLAAIERTSREFRDARVSQDYLAERRQERIASEESVRALRATFVAESKGPKPGQSKSNRGLRQERQAPRTWDWARMLKHFIRLFCLLVLLLLIAPPPR